MDDETLQNIEFYGNTTINDPGSSSYTGAFFPRSRQLVVNGGSFASNVTNNIHHAALSPPADLDYRRISWGDIDLRYEIKFNDQSGIAHRDHGHRSVRRMYQAKIEGREADMTVAVYEGDNSEEEWKRDISKYSRLRHPNILQVFGAASSPGIHAIIANDDLILLPDLLKLHQHSPISTIYIYSFCDTDYSDVYNYMRSKFQHQLDSIDCRLWIRRSTYRLCMELSISDIEQPILRIVSFNSRHVNDGRSPLDHPDQEAKLIDSLELAQYQSLCYLHLRRGSILPISVDAEFNLGAVRHCPSATQLEDSAEVAVLTCVDIYPWKRRIVNGPEGLIMQDGWTRYNSRAVFGQEIRSRMVRPRAECWLSQANYIFTRLQITSNHKDYVMTPKACFKLRVSVPLPDPPEGYLFVCPAEHFRTGPTTFRWPGDPAHWSLDPSGGELLSADEARHLGFPSIEMTTEIWAYSWQTSVYAGLHKFHQAKGFDP